MSGQDEIGGRDSAILSPEIRRTLDLCQSSAGPGIEGGMHRVGVASFAPDVLAKLGVDPDVTARAAGIEPELLRNAESPISFVALGRYVAKCVEFTGCSYFGVLVGQRASLNTLGMVGRLMRQAPTLGIALQDIAIHHVRYIRGAAVTLQPFERETYFGYVLYQQSVAAREQICCAAMAVAQRIIFELVGACEYDVYLAQSPPTRSVERARIERAFGRRVYFNADRYALLISEKDINRAVRGANPSERQSLQKDIDAFWLKAPPTFCHLVHRTVISQLITGTISLSLIAQSLRMHPRSLERRLEEEGTSFLMIRDAARYEIARQLLIGTRMNLLEISRTVGYSDPSIFSRTFRKWSGTAPRAFRNSHNF